jgi:aerobic carbon-monoxide dehydrogenase large subunit
MTDLLADPAVIEKPAGFVGTNAVRKEDERLLRGAGSFVDDIDRKHALEMAVGRCPYPHARIRSIDVTAAMELPGVHHVLVGAEVAARSGTIGLLREDAGAPELPFFALAQDVARYEGQPVVSVVASSRHIAEDALELIEIDYEPLPHVSDIESALAPDAPVIYPEHMTSNLLTSQVVERGDVDARFAEADVVVEGSFYNVRVTALPMETRAVLAEWNQGDGELTVHSSTQGPYVIRRQLAEVLRLPESRIRVVTRDVGGGFGLKLGVYPEDVLASLHAMALRRPVRWIEDRNEHFRGSGHARESLHDYRIAARADGTILAMENVYTNDLGAASFAFGASQQSTIVFSGPYRVTDGRVDRQVAVTNKTPVNSYRGFGQPEVNFAYERLMDRLARQLGVDPVELRAMNMLRPDELPWVNPAGGIYDSGTYEKSLRMAAEAVDYASLRRRERRQSDGRLRGVGFSSYVERTGTAKSPTNQKSTSLFGPHESVTLRANWTGGIDLYTGVSSFGQGSETVFAQMCSDATGVGYDLITVHVGDTGSSPPNTGGFASRTVIAAAGAISEAGAALRSRTLSMAGWVLDGADPDDLEIRDGVVEHRSGTGPSISLAEIFRRAIVGEGIPPGTAPGLEETAYFAPADVAYAFGTAAVVVLVDPDTGDFEFERLVMVHDAGKPINPRLVEGQVRGGIVQALGAALGEELRYDADTGQLVNGTMMDYFAPLANDVPAIELHHTEVPSPVTPLGVRGAGESGAIPIAAAVANAVCDALVEFGVELDRLPITPEVVWRAIAESPGRHSSSISERPNGVAR